MKCETCKMKRVCDKLERMGKVPKHEKCRCYTPTKPITNADNIRAMTDEELSIFFSIRVACFFCPMTFDCEGRKMGKDYCKEKWLNWLKSELEKESE